MNDPLFGLVIALAGGLFGMTALLWWVLLRSPAARVHPLDPAQLAWWQGEVVRMNKEAAAQRTEDLAAIRRRLYQHEAYAVEVADAYQRLCGLYNALRRHLAVLEARLATWPEVMQDLPAYSAADPPPLPTPPWLQEEK